MTTPEDEKKAKAAARIESILRGEVKPATAGSSSGHTERETPWNPNANA